MTVSTTCYIILLLSLVTVAVLAKLQCDPDSNTRRPDPADPNAYFYCSLEGIYARRQCVFGKQFNATTLECRATKGVGAGVALTSASTDGDDDGDNTDDPFLRPMFQAPDDLCGAGVALTRISAPVACNPSLKSSCPDGYVCTLYSRTGTAYCCQNPSTPTIIDAAAVVTPSIVYCTGNQVTYIETSGQPRSCILGSSNSGCPIGFGCNLVGGSMTRCCGQAFGCPYNSAGFVNPTTGGYVPCTLGSTSNNCQNGFVCIQSAIYESAICCSDTATSTTTTPTPPPANQICSGAAALTDPNNQIQQCASIACPIGYVCQSQQYCCPTPDFACTQSVTTGNICAVGVQKIAWYYDSISGTCKQFTYLGCAGNANRFVDQSSCIQYCSGSSSAAGSCPFPLTAYIPAGLTTVQRCTLNVVGTCPTSASCVRSSTNIPICCQGVANCPANRAPYIIPGSNSVVSCQPEFPNTCPIATECVESSNVAGLYLCCSQPSATIPSQPTCPNGLVNSTTQTTCTINAINACTGAGYLCIRGTPTTTTTTTSTSSGVCCQTSPTCLSQLQPYYIPGSANQVQVCQSDLAGCPGGTVCAASTVPSLSICCSLTPTVCVGNFQPYIPPGSSAVQQCQLNAIGPQQCPLNYNCQQAVNSPLTVCCPLSPSAFIMCSTGVVPYYKPASTVPLSCNVLLNQCPTGYSCQSSSTAGQYVCCPSVSTLAAECVDGTAYMLYRRPLSCPQGSSACPTGYSCQQSNVNDVYLCCSAVSSTGNAGNNLPNCARGTAYTAPGTDQRRYCSPSSNENICPTNYACQASTIDGQFICCSTTTFSSQYSGYCAMGQIPYIPPGRVEPRSCHMTFNPCPTAAPYSCIFSAARQNSYCCAPIATRFHSTSVSAYYRRPSGTGNDRYVITTNAHRSQPLNGSGGGRVPIAASPPKQTCPKTRVQVGNACLPLYRPGQKGCTVNEQCLAVEPGSYCDTGYCMCPSYKVLHRGQCVSSCPDGFINIAAQCNDIMHIIFMDSVGERDNGTIGGWCLDTLVREKQCRIVNAVCSDRSLTCQCEQGFELKLAFDDSTDDGKCVELKSSSKWSDNSLLHVDDDDMVEQIHLLQSNDHLLQTDDHHLLLMVDDE